MTCVLCFSVFIFYHYYILFFFEPPLIAADLSALFSSLVRQSKSDLNVAKLLPLHPPPLTTPCSEGKRHSPAPGCNLGGAERGETFLAGTSRQAPLRATAGPSGGTRGLQSLMGDTKPPADTDPPLCGASVIISCRKVALQLHFIPITSAATGSLRRRLGNLARPT